MQLYPCPLCGRSSDEDLGSFSGIDETVAHIDAAEDDDHAGERGADHVDAISRNMIDLDRYREATSTGEAPDLPADGGEGTTTISFSGGEPTITTADGERPLGEVLESLNEHVTQLHGKFTAVAQDQRHQLEGVQEATEVQKLAIQELQAGMEALAEELGKDVDYQFEL